MASRGKKKTTFAKLAREAKLRERRAEKAAKKDARKRAAELGLDPLAEPGHDSELGADPLAEMHPAQLGDTPGSEDQQS